MPSSSEPDLVVVDLHEALANGLDRGAHLLTAGEQHVAERILALQGDPATVYARLVGRKPLAFPLDELAVPRVDDPSAALPLLDGLVDRLVPWSWRVALSPRRRLVEGCRRLGLPTTGKREDVAARLLPHTGWDPSPWVRPRHRGLVRRLQRWATLSAWPAEHEPVLERMGQVRFPDYALTTGPALHRDRADLLAWEAVHSAIGAESLPVDVALGALSLKAPGGLSLLGTLRRLLEEHARGLERDRPDQALALYEAMVAAGIRPARVAFRKARTLEALGRPADALSTLLDARTEAMDDERRALERAGRRLARSLRRGFPPEPPLRPARDRQLSLVRAGSAQRPLWRAGDAAVPVEDAVVHRLGALGRRAVHTEGRIWRTLCSLLLVEAMFLPVPGALPVRRLTGPLDYRRPGFRQRRPLVEALLTRIRAGEAEAMLGEQGPRWEGVRVAGVDPSLPLDLLLDVVRAVPGPALSDLVARMLDTRSSGMPDLVVLPGEEVMLPGHPQRLGPELHLVEVKGPGDTVFDRQRLWHHELLGWGLRVEKWDVTEGP